MRSNLRSISRLAKGLDHDVFLFEPTFGAGKSLRSTHRSTITCRRTGHCNSYGRLGRIQEDVTRHQYREETSGSDIHKLPRKVQVSAATMATAHLQKDDPSYLHALVDMGSNGIRFSITTLAPPTARITPTLYQGRAGISLYDAQYPAPSNGVRQPIDSETIKGVVSAYRSFKRTCADFGVPENNVTVLATEATRTAINGQEFMQSIREAVGWEVKLLAKAEEGRVGAMGVASSLPEVKGLMMDLGGGSTQLSWLMGGKEDVKMPESGAVSMPYGAAALTRRLGEAEAKGRKALDEFQTEVRETVKDAYESLRVPSEMLQKAEDEGGFTLYLSGGGFRGWGYILMSQHQVKPYPIPVINGFKVSRKDFLSTAVVQQAAAAVLEGDEDGSDDIFRISARRAGQVPAVAFLVNALSQALPQVKEIRFCQGGVREGYLFSSLPSEVQAQHPLVVATEPFEIRGTSSSMADLLLSAFPQGSSAGAQDDYRTVFDRDLVHAFANLMYFHSSHSKDLQATSALRSTTSGVLAGVHGILHESRALLGLLLCARWGGGVPPSDESFKRNLEQIVESDWTLWWINYFGAVSALVSEVFPAGFVKEDPDRLRLEAKWDRDEKGRSALLLHLSFSQGMDAAAFGKSTKGVEKVGKKKRWIGGKDGSGHRIEVVVV
jgi:retrograde regulation protein 2